MLVRGVTPSSLNSDRRPRLFLPSMPERCDSTPAKLLRWETLTGFILRQRRRTSCDRYKTRLGLTEFAFGRRRLLFRAWNDRVYSALSPPPRLLLRKRLPPLSVQRLTTGPGPPASN